MKNRLLLALSSLVIAAMVVYVAVSCNKKDDFKALLGVNVTSFKFTALPDSAATITITSNTSWTVASSESWLTVSPASGSKNGTVTITAQQNTDTLTRTATITFSTEGAPPQTVTVTQIGALAVSASSFSLEASGNGVGAFVITSDTNWTVTSSQSWLTVSPASGSHNGMVAVTARQNKDTASRIATITIFENGDTTKTLTVTQSGARYDVVLSKTSLTLAVETNNTDSITIGSDTSWTVTSSQSWLTVSPASGLKNGIIYVTAQEKKDTSARTATITVSGTMSTPQIISVTQLGAEISMTVSKKWFSIKADINSTDTFTLYSNVSWTVTSSQSWLTVSPTSGSNNGVITVTANTANTVGTNRKALVTMPATGGESKQIVTVYQDGIPCVPGDETPCSVNGCTVPAMPSFASLTPNAFLPDPFMFMNGTRMTTKAEWTCRRAEIATLVEEFEYGYKPCTPYSATTGSFSGNKLTVTVTGNGKTISFDCTITLPSAGTAPYPAMIGYGYSSLDNALLSSLGVAIISFPNDDIAQQTNASSSRGKGKFYDFFCSSHSASAIMAWAWGVSRLIDALEKTPSANIDPTRLGVTGCSRNGKGALAAGAYDERIVLTIPQESGSGGAASWRVSDYQGTTVQTLSEITGEAPWFRTNFNQFGSKAKNLPFDHHMIEALCAPRALLVIENTSMVWLGNLSTWTTGNAAHTVWEALGIPDKMGFSQSGHSDHCGFPAAQQPELKAYVLKFLVGGGTDDTNVMKTDGSLLYDKEKWQNWTVPALQ
jgi:hypothetical protein